MESPRSSIYSPSPQSQPKRCYESMSNARCGREHEMSEKAHYDSDCEQQTVSEFDNKTSRQVRSRPIPIKSVPRQELDDEGQHAQRYDWDTWRMYCRITEHRAKHPLSSGFNVQPQPAVAVPMPTVPTIFFPVQSVSPMTTVPHDHFSGAHEDEIFELEM